MRTRTLGLAVALTAVAATAGCGLTGSPPKPSAHTGEVTVDGNSHHTQSIDCTQVQWDLTVKANTDPGQARAFLELGSEKPVVRTVNIEGFDHRGAIVSGKLGNAQASVDGGTYTITGTAVGPDPANPAQTKDVPFTIKVPC